ncbi:MAG TPA: glycosyltransferase [Desulfitobacteriaceae bacterium]|nr:glycosyltransferase [Desulfitobacteriaceae bacterium]
MTKNNRNKAIDMVGTNSVRNIRNIKFSIIIPVHNEEKLIGRCLDSIAAASVFYKDQVEVIVVLNRCTDRTAEIALVYDFVVITREDAKNMSKIRNAGAKIARGEIIATIDADNWMTDNMLTEIDRMLMNGKYIGGGVRWKTEKKFSLGTFFTVLILIPLLIKFRCPSAGILWCYKKDYQAINGFNENQRMLEDAEFSLRLRKWGKRCGKKYGTITKAQMVVSSRKEDMFGEWMLFKHPKWLLAYLRGNVEKYADEAFYDLRENYNK